MISKVLIGWQCKIIYTDSPMKLNYFYNIIFVILLKGNLMFYFNLCYLMSINYIY